MKLVPIHIGGDQLNNALKEIGALFERNQVDVSLGGKGQYISKERNEVDISCDEGPRPYSDY